MRGRFSEKKADSEIKSSKTRSVLVFASAASCRENDSWTVVDLFVSFLNLADKLLSTDTMVSRILAKSAG